MSILELKNIRKSFDNKVVLDGIDLTVKETTYAKEVSFTSVITSLVTGGSTLFTICGKRMRK